MIGDCVAASTFTVRVAMELKASIAVLLFAVHRIVLGLPPLLHPPCNARFRLVSVSTAVVVPSVGAVAPGTPEVTGTVVQVSAVVVERTAVDAVMVVPVAALLR